MKKFTRANELDRRRACREATHDSVFDIIGARVANVPNTHTILLETTFLNSDPSTPQSMSFVLSQQSAYQISRDLLKAVREYLGDEDDEIE